MGIQHTRSRFRVFEEILPEIIIILFLGELDGLEKELSRNITLMP